MSGNVTYPNLEYMVKVFKILTILLAVVAVCELIVVNSLSVDCPLSLFNFHWAMMWIGFGGCALSAISWGIAWFYEDELESKRRAEKRIKESKEREEKQKIANEALGQFWPHGEESVLGVIDYKEAIFLCRVSVKYVCESDDYNILLSRTHAGYVKTDSYKVKLNENMLVGTQDGVQIVLKTDSLKVGDIQVDLNQETPLYQRAQILLAKFLDGVSIDTVQLSRLESCEDEEAVLKLPRFTFTLTPEGVKCNQINLAERRLKQYFDRNAGGPYLVHNEIFYIEYCKDGYLPTFGIDAYRLSDYLSSVRFSALKMGLTNMNTEFNIPSWNTQIDRGARRAFREMKGYISRGVMHYVPAVVSKTADFIVMEPPIVTLENEHLDSSLMKKIAYHTWVTDYLQSLKNGGEEDTVTISLTEHNETVISFDNEYYVTHPCLRANED